MKIVIKGRRKNVTDILEFFLCAMLVIAPILQQHKGFYINGGWSALLIGAPFCLARLTFGVWRVKRTVAGGLVLIALYFFYTFIDHGFSTGDIMRMAILLLYYLVLSKENFNFKYILYISAGIALAACAGLVIQYISYYIFHRKFQFLNVNTLLDTSTRWYARIRSEGITGAFYRPSAFFLEPSHMFIFSFPPALYLLFSEQANKRTRILGFIIVGGILATTSGMGIIFSLGCFVAYYVMYKNPWFKEGSITNFFTPRRF